MIGEKQLSETKKQPILKSEQKYTMETSEGEQLGIKVIQFQMEPVQKIVEHQPADKKEFAKCNDVIFRRGGGTGES